jgi:hypothetical protein
MNLMPNDGLCLMFNFNLFNNTNKSRINRLVDKINYQFKKIKSPLRIENTNMHGYLSQQVAIDTLQYFLKNNHDLILDFYIPNDISNESVYFIKR